MAVKDVTRTAPSRVMHHAVHGRAQQRSLQGVSHAAGQANDIEQRPGHGQPPRAYPGDARGVGGRVQAVNHPGQQQDDEQVRHGGRMTREPTAAQAAIGQVLSSPDKEPPVLLT
jgi:hypothetical protein